MVLRNLLFISTSGIVLFSKEFINGISKPGQLGGIITSMLTFSTQKTGLPVSYIELANIGVAITSHTEARVSCAVFHDSQDGSEFGKLMAKQLLDAFTNMFASELHDRLSAPGSFDSFNSRISDVIRGSVRPVLEHLQEQRGINVAMLCSGDSVVYSSTEVDKISVLANHQALLGVATDLMAAQNDITSSLTLKSRRTTLILQRVERSSLIVVFKNSVDPSICIKEIDRAAHLLRQVLVMASNLKT